MTTSAEIAKQAIENVCSGREADRVADTTGTFATT
jgi:hypothetical protein